MNIFCTYITVNSYVSGRDISIKAESLMLRPWLEAIRKLFWLQGRDHWPPEFLGPAASTLITLAAPYSVPKTVHVQSCLFQGTQGHVSVPWLRHCFVHAVIYYSALICGPQMMSRRSQRDYVPFSNTRSGHTPLMNPI